MTELNNVIRCEREYFLIQQAFTTKDIDLLRKSIKVGDRISFVRSGYRDRDSRIRITGTVKEKYPYIFSLEDGRTFTWVDYLIGKNMPLHPRLTCDGNQFSSIHSPCKEVEFC